MNRLSLSLSLSEGLFVSCALRVSLMAIGVGLLCRSVSPALASQHQHQGSITILTPQEGDTLADVVRVKVQYSVGLGCAVDEVLVYATEVADHGSDVPAFDMATESEDGRSGTREYKWDTCPLHSGEWLLTAEVLHRIPGTPPEEHVVARRQITVRMDNLVIKSEDASTFRLTREYLVWNGKLSPATLEATTIPALTLHDAAPGLTTVWVKIYDPLTGYLVKTYTQEVAMSGTDHTVPPTVWDGTWDIPVGDRYVSIVAPPGIYVYDVRAWQRCGNGIAEHDYYRRVSHDQHLALLPYPLEARVTSYDPATEQGTVVVRFRLASGRTEPSPPKIKVSLNDPDYLYGGQTLPSTQTQTGVLGENVVEFTNFPLRKAGFYPIVIQAWDEERAADKQHLSKPALERAPALYLPPPAVGFAADDPGLWLVTQNRVGQWIPLRSIFAAWNSTPALGPNAFGNLSAVSFPHYANERKPFSPIHGFQNNRQNTQTSRARDGLNTAAGKVAVSGAPWPGPTERRAAVWFFIGHGDTTVVRSIFYPPPVANFGVFFREEDPTTFLRLDANLQPIPPVPRVYSALVVPGISNVPLWIRESVLLQGQLDHLLCVLVAGCATASEAGPTNIAKRFRELGARSSIGVMYSERIQDLNDFAAKFWQYATKGYVEKGRWYPPIIYKAAEKAAAKKEGKAWRMYATEKEKQSLSLYPPRYGFQKP